MGSVSIRSAMSGPFLLFGWVIRLLSLPRSRVLHGLNPRVVVGPQHGIQLLIVKRVACSHALMSRVAILPSLSVK